MIYFTSDQHFYHRNVILYCKRPFASQEEFDSHNIREESVVKMNEILIAKYNSIVKPEDTVYHLGDFSMAFRAVEIFTKRLNGTKILYAGNHDWCFPSHKKSRSEENQKKWAAKYIENGFSEVRIVGEMDIPGVAKVNINHLPYLEGGSSQDIRHGKFRPKDDGRWLLCGHVHEKWAQRGKMINVGVDVRNFEPISIDQIVAIINAQPDGYPMPKWEVPKEDY